MLTGSLNIDEMHRRWNDRYFPLEQLRVVLDILYICRLIRHIPHSCHRSCPQVVVGTFTNERDPLPPYSPTTETV